MFQHIPPIQESLSAPTQAAQARHPRLPNALLPTRDPPLLPRQCRTTFSPPLPHSHPSIRIHFHTRDPHFSLPQYTHKCLTHVNVSKHSPTHRKVPALPAELRKLAVRSRPMLASLPETLPSPLISMGIPDCLLSPVCQRSYRTRSSLWM